MERQSDDDQTAVRGPSILASRKGSSGLKHFTGYVSLDGKEHPAEYIRHSLEEINDKIAADEVELQEEDEEKPRQDDLVVVGTPRKKREQASVEVALAQPMATHNTAGTETGRNAASHPGGLSRREPYSSEAASPEPGAVLSAERMAPKALYRGEAPASVNTINRSFVAERSSPSDAPLPKSNDVKKRYSVIDPQRTDSSKA